MSLTLASVGAIVTGIMLYNAMQPPKIEAYKAGKKEYYMNARQDESSAGRTPLANVEECNGLDCATEKVNSHYSSLDLSRRKFYSHARRSDTDEMLLVEQLRGPGDKVKASFEATSESAPAALKRVLRKLKNEKSIEVDPSTLIGYNAHYKLPEKYYYEPKGTSLFEQVTLRNGSNIVENLKKSTRTNKFQMGTTLRVYEEMRKR